MNSPWLFVHAHPDDEVLATGAILLALRRAGTECRVLTCSRGEQGEAIPGSLPPGVKLAEVRERELACSLATLGVAGPGLFLGAAPARAEDLAPRRYTDSGMRWVTPTVAGPGESAGPDSLTAAPLAEVVGDIVAGARANPPGALVSYDDDGGYGHPDHIRAHAATLAAARILGLPYLAITTRRDLADHWYEAGPDLDQLVAAHGCYPTQFRVEQRPDGPGIVHVGGQHQDLVSAGGLRRVV